MSLYPFLRSPFTDLTGFMFNAQTLPNTLCAKLEMRVYDCIEAYGLDKAKEKCTDLMEDYKECSFRFKEDARSLRMRAERHRQYYTGEREKHYEEPPKIHSL